MEKEKEKEKRRRRRSQEETVGGRAEFLGMNVSEDGSP